MRSSWAWTSWSPITTTRTARSRGAVATLNPSLPESTYPFIGLAGVGVAYKLVHALAEELPDRLPYPEEFLDLVALGTVGDVAPLQDENRTFVSEGLAQLRQTHRVGLRALGASRAASSRAGDRRDDRILVRAAAERGRAGLRMHSSRSSSFKPSIRFARRSWRGSWTRSTRSVRRLTDDCGGGCDTRPGSRVADGVRGERRLPGGDRGPGGVAFVRLDGVSGVRRHPRGRRSPRVGTIAGRRAPDRATRAQRGSA